MLRLATDADVHGEVVRGLRRRAPEIDLVRAQDALPIGTPDPQVLAWAAAQGRVPAWQPAMLEDRVRRFEGRPQRYGSALEPDEEGCVRPWVIEDPDGVEARRRAVGLPPLAERLAGRERIVAPEALAAWRRGYEAWLRRVGWRA